MIQSLLNKEVSGILVQHHYKLCALAQGNSKTRLFIIIAIICSTQQHIQPYLMHRRKCNALLRIACTLNYIPRAGQPNIRARLMPEHNFGWTHTCRIMVLLGLPWQKWQQGAQLLYELDSVFCLPQDISPIVQKYRIQSLKHCHVHYPTQPVQYCFTSMGRQKNASFHPLSLFIWQRGAGK